MKIFGCEWPFKIRGVRVRLRGGELDAGVPRGNSLHRSHELATTFRTSAFRGLLSPTARPCRATAVAIMLSGGSRMEVAMKDIYS